MADRGVCRFADEQQLGNFATSLASNLTVPMVIWLQGDLGTGKTAFARALIQAMGYTARVKSPTYGLLEQYPLATCKVLHMDLYRIGEPEEIEFLGLPDLMDDQTLVLIEWPEKGGRWLPEPDFVFDFNYASPGRDLHWTACSESAQALDIQKN